MIFIFYPPNFLYEPVQKFATSYKSMNYNVFNILTHNVCYLPPFVIPSESEKSPSFFNKGDPSGNALGITL